MNTGVEGLLLGAVDPVTVGAYDARPVAEPEHADAGLEEREPGVVTEHKLSNS